MFSGSSSRDRGSIWALWRGGKCLDMLRSAAARRAARCYRTGAGTAHGWQLEVLSPFSRQQGGVFTMVGVDILSDRGRKTGA